MLLRDDHFHEINEVRVDSKRRVALGKVEHPYERYVAYENDAGQIVLDPHVSIPASESWLYKNPKALKSVRKGLEDAKEGRLAKSKEDFTKYADDSK